MIWSKLRSKRKPQGDRAAGRAFLLAAFATWLATPVLCSFAREPGPLPGSSISAATANPAAGQKHPAKPDAGHHSSDVEQASSKDDRNAYDYSLPGADGKAIPLSTFKGKYILLVNLGRKSTYNLQLPALVHFNEAYKDKGFVVIGIPSDDFGKDEPGTDAEIQKAYADAKAEFPIAGVSRLRGDEELPLYLYLTTGKGVPAGGPVHWNYTKFIIDRNGKVIARFDPDVAPDSAEMLSVIGKILDGSYKPKLAGGEHKEAAETPAADDDDE